MSVSIGGGGGWLVINMQESSVKYIVSEFLLKKHIFTALKRSLWRLCFYTYLSVRRRGSTWAGTPSPWTGTPTVGTPPWAGTPTREGTSPGRYPPGAVHAGIYGQQAGGTHPTGMHSCIQRNLTFLSKVQSCKFSHIKKIKFYYLYKGNQIIYGLGALTLACLKTARHAIPRFRTQEVCPFIPIHWCQTRWSNNHSRNWATIFVC